MALVAMTTSAVLEFVSDMDPSKKKKKVSRDPADETKGFEEVIEIGDDASVFKVRVLDVFLMGHIYDRSSVLAAAQGQKEISVHTRINQTNIDTVRFGLVNIPDNFRDKMGVPVRMKTEKEVINGREYDVAVVDVLTALGLQLINEMAIFIKSNSEVTAAEAKK